MEQGRQLKEGITHRRSKIIKGELVTSVCAGLEHFRAFVGLAIDLEYIEAANNAALW